MIPARVKQALKRFRVFFPYLLEEWVHAINVNVKCNGLYLGHAAAQVVSVLTDVSEFQSKSESFFFLQTVELRQKTSTELINDGDFSSSSVFHNRNITWLSWELWKRCSSVLLNCFTLSSCFGTIISTQIPHKFCICFLTDMNTCILATFFELLHIHYLL